MAEAVQITDGHATLEASGGLTLERARDGQRPVRYISVGALTHSAGSSTSGWTCGGVTR